ncbi:MAG: hypothetical protein ACRC20_13430 [Segniliparus sp.]|uniref:hypothetical protein n=1 Tax=Segniliparus sp. TaxID=2804064 RepID=UPI003F2BB56E
MRITLAGKILIVWLTLASALTSCSLLEKAREIKRGGSTASSQDSNSTTHGNTSQTTVEALKSLPLFKDVATSMEQQDCVFDFADAKEREQSLKRYIKEEVECLNHAWQEPLKATGSSPSPQHPNIRYTDKTAYDTACEKGLSEASAECSQQGLTFQISNTSYYADSNSLDTTWALVEVVSTYSYWLLDALGEEEIMNNLADKTGPQSSQGHEIYRRHNLSAWCLSGVYVGAQTGHNPDEQEFFHSVYNNQNNVVANTSSSPENGDTPTGQHQLDWFRKGVDSGGRPSACNTWAAPASEVS